MKKPEILAPAGSMEKLKFALRFGADAVYLGDSNFSLRAQGKNFGQEELTEAVRYTHDCGKKVYVTVNIYPHEGDLADLGDYLRFLETVGADAALVSDLGLFSLARQVAPGLPLHVSTQANTLNSAAINAWASMGAERVVLGREVSIEELKKIRAATNVELEMFVHGAMCMSFSGRCLISSYLTRRDANRGECAQPCRWNYRLVEEKRPGQYFPIFEDERGSYLLNAKDLCMIEHIDKLAQAGITSFKIEGRAKSAYYTAVITNAYRGAIDAYRRDPERFEPPPWTLEEVNRVSHREYSTGFYFDRPDQRDRDGGYIREWEIVAVVDGWEDGSLVVTERNRFTRGDRVEIMIPHSRPVLFEIGMILDPECGEVESACHPMRRYLLPYDTPLPAGSILRRQAAETI